MNIYILLYRNFKNIQFSSNTCGTFIKTDPVKDNTASLRLHHYLNQYLIDFIRKK